jgi:hypothetical protein
MSHSIRSCGVLLLFAVLATLLSPARAQSNKPNATHLFVTYRCKPADRPAFLKLLRTDQLARLEQWKVDGAIADYQLLFNQFVDENTWDATLMLRFASYEQTARWRTIEQEYPGGLDQKGLALGTPVTSYLADLELSAGAPGDRSKSIFVLIPYTWADRASYMDFIRVYGAPQFDAWVKDGAVASYGVYTNHHATGKPWDAMLVFEYRDIEALGRREQVKQASRVALAKEPAWRQASAGKAEVRTEHEVVMAAPVVAGK